MTSIGPLTSLPYGAHPSEVDGSRPNAARFRENLQNQTERLRNAVENENIDPVRARDIRDKITDRRERLHDRVIDRPTDRPIDRPRPDGDDKPIDPAKVREHLQNLKERLKNAVENGKLSPERARKIYQKNLARAKEALGIGDGDDTGNGPINPARIRKHLQHLKGRLQNAVGNGDLSPEQAREIWSQHVERAKTILGQGNDGDGSNGGIERPDFETIAGAKRGNAVTIEA